MHRTMHNSSPLAAILRAVLFLVLLASGTLSAQTAAPDDELSQRQRRIAERFSAFEQQMLKMAQLEASTNPRRAALLQEVLKQSGDRHTRLQLETIVSLLGKRQLSKAVKEQGDAEQGLQELLKLLQSENRTERLKSEQERVKEYIKEVERMIRIQRSLEGQTEGETDPKRLSEEQGKLADRAEELIKKIEENEESKPQDENETSKEKQPSESEPKKSDDDKKPDENKKPDSDKPSDDKKPSEPNDAEKKPSENSKKGESSEPMPPSGESPESSEEKPMEADPMNAQEKNPARKRIEEAREKMKSAEKKLNEAKRKESLEDQQKAKEELEKAKAELEKILKQLREEEVERTLAALEGRFRKMLEMQLRVLDGTKKLVQIPAMERTRENDIQAGRLGGEEQKIVLEAEKALQLLHEEGSSVAFPATVDLMLDDMRQVAQRLNQAKLDAVTVGLEEDIVAALEELLASLEQAKKEQEEKKQQEEQKQGQPPGQQENALVGAIQELKMIKSLQIRVNSRTDRYAKMLKDQNDPVGQAEARELLDALDKLSERQKQVYEIVRKLVLGKNQ